MPEYTEEPSWNWKCLFFTAFLAGGYWFAPPKNKWVLLSLMYFPYIAMAQYDYAYEAQRNMSPTYLSLFYAWAKPPESEQMQQYKNWSPEIKEKVLAVDAVILLVLLAATPRFLAWEP